MKKIISLLYLSIILIQGSSSGAAPFAVPTFECLGVYWNPSSGGSKADPCQVQYRRQGDAAWKQGFPLVYFFRDTTITDAQGNHPLLGGKYRGSIVNLTPNTTYEIKLNLTTGGDSAVFTAKTWTENFPIAQTIELPVTSSTTLNIAQSGFVTGYILYAPKSGTTATIDVNNSADNCVSINGSYIILRNVTLKNGKKNGILLGNVHDVVIDKCDISGWGQINDDGAVRSTSTSLERIIIQRSKLHHPRADANNWNEPVALTHPEGPQAIDFYESNGNHVFRYNEIYSDADHYFNDCLGGGYNNSYKGYPGKDSDIYGNYIGNCWDDGLELDGGDRNVRVWGNYIEHIANAISCAPTTIGPIYLWKNVIGRTQWTENGQTDLEYPVGGPGTFYKGGNASDSSLMGGQIYIFHNTLLQSPTGPYTPSSGCGMIRLFAGAVKRSGLLPAVCI